MDIEKFREICLSQPASTEDFPFDEDVLVFRVCNKIFAAVSLSHPEIATLKCDADYAIELRQQYEAIEPAFHWNKKYWNQIWFNRDVSDEVYNQLIEHSYKEVVKKLSKKQQAEIM